MVSWLKSIYRLKLNKRRKRIIELEKEIKYIRDYLNYLHNMRCDLECKLDKYSKEYEKINKYLS